MKRFSNIGILLALSLFATPLLRLGAQQVDPNVSEFIREIIREKMKVPPDQMKRLLVPGDSSLSGPWSAFISKATGNERIVSNDPLPESEVHAVINQADRANVVVSAMRQNMNNPTEVLLCPVYFSKDFGQTWGKSAFRNVPTEPGAMILGGGDPVFAADADGKLYFSWINLYMLNMSRLYIAMCWAYSTDGGETWIRPSDDVIGKAEIVSMMDPTEAFDKQWLAVDRTNSPHRNTLYAAFCHPDKDGLKIGLRKKEQGADAFTKTSVRVSSPGYKFVQFSSIDVDPQGDVHVTFFGSQDSLHYALYHARSTDGGETFQTETKVSDVTFPRFSVDDPNGEIKGLDNQRIYPCPHIVADHSGAGNRGNLYMVWTANGVTAKEANGTDIYFSRSTDNGTTWSEPVIVNDDPRGLIRDQFHPSIAVNENGVIAVTWYDRRDDAGNMSAHYYLAYSFDGGKTFEKNTPVTTTPMDFARAGSVNRGFSIGEYTQVVMTNDYAVPFWTDGRTNTGNLDIYSAFIPIQAGTFVERISPVMGGFSLHDNYPNPFNPATTISYSIERTMRVRLVVGNSLGVTITTLVDETQNAGTYRYSFDASHLPSGTYNYTLFTDAGIAIKTMTLLK